MSKILIVDDELSYRELLELFVQREGYDTRVTSTGEEAINLGRTYRPDVLLIDWLLRNHYNGLEISAILKKEDMNLQTILITGVVSTEIRQKAFDADVFRFIEKPFDAPQIIEAIRDALKKT